MRALVTGAAGVLGTWLLRRAPADVEIIALVHRRPVDHAETIAVDLRDGNDVRRAVGEVRPDVIVHAAYAKDRSSIVDATANVAQAARGAGAGLVHVSTDAVFAGDGRPRPETDRPDPVSAYGRWKAEAERAADAGCPGAVVVRLPLIVSTDPPDHVVEAIRRDAAGDAPEPTTWFTDELRQPALASDLADALWALAALPDGERAGPWHLPGPEVLSRAELAARAAATVGLDPGGLVRGPTPPGLRRPRAIHLTADRAERVLGWRPRPVHA